MRFCRSVIRSGLLFEHNFSENRFPLFGVMLFSSMIFSENRFPLFGIMLWRAAMLAPHFSCLLTAQSDFGHPAGAALPTRSRWTSLLRTFPQNLACGAYRRIARDVHL